MKAWANIYLTKSQTNRIETQNELWLLKTYKWINSYLQAYLTRNQIRNDTGGDLTKKRSRDMQSVHIRAVPTFTNLYNKQRQITNEVPTDQKERSIND